MQDTDLIESEAPSTEPVSTRVVTAVAEARDVDPTDVPPLHQVVDPDALDWLFHPQPPGTAPPSGQVTFTLAGCTVVVERGGRVTVTAAEPDGENGTED